MKKIFGVLLSVLCICCAAIGLTGCKKDKHIHAFDKQVVTDEYKATDATCTEAATYYYSCSCGEKGTETFGYGSPLGHSFTNYVSDNNATCTQDSTKTAKCDRCNEKNTVIAIGTKLGHSFTNYVSDNNATCTQDGTKTAVCDRDGCNAKDTVTDTGSKLPHTFDKQVANEKYLASAATCTESAKYYYSCSCGEKGTETFTYGVAKGHTEVIDRAKAATCTDSGLTEGKHCSVCNTVLVKQNVVPAKGHTEVIDKAKAATCIETGLTEGKHCSVCNKILIKQEIIPAKGHTEVIDKAKAATCTETGLTEGKHCSVCNTVLVKQNIVPAKGHTYAEEWLQSETEHWHVATCGHNLEKDRAKHNFVNNVCTVCKYDRTIAITNVSLNKTTLTLNIDDQETLSATVLPTDATDKTIVWSSSDTNVAIVNNGVVTAIAKGTTTITAKCGNVSATCSVTVNVEFVFEEYGTGYALVAYNGNDTEVTVPATYKGKNVIIIGAGKVNNYHYIRDAFSDNTKIKRVILPDTVRNINNASFMFCSSLEEIVMPKVENIGAYAFYQCTSLKEMNLPTTLINIYSYAFAGCTLLKKVNLPTGLLNIFSNAFSGCSSIEYIDFPSSLQTIQNCAFYKCNSLTDIKLNNTNVTISDSAFLDCALKPNITVPETPYEFNNWTTGGNAYFPNWIHTTVIINNVEVKLKGFNSDSASVMIYIHGTKTYDYYGSSHRVKFKYRIKNGDTVLGSGFIESASVAEKECFIAETSFAVSIKIPINELFNENNSLSLELIEVAW